MPLRDHFRPPLDNVASWEELHGRWPMVIVQQLVKNSRPAMSLPHVFTPGRKRRSTSRRSKKTMLPPFNGMGEANGGVATAVSAPPAASLAIETEVPDFDEYEVRIYDAQRGRHFGCGHRDRQSREQRSSRASQCLCRQVCGAPAKRRRRQHRRSRDRSALQSLCRCVSFFGPQRPDA